MRARQELELDLCKKKTYGLPENNTVSTMSMNNSPFASHTVQSKYYSKPWFGQNYADIQLYNNIMTFEGDCRHLQQHGQLQPFIMPLVDQILGQIRKQRLLDV
jgi:hypothetical protein